MKFISLCIKEENLNITEWLKNEQQELEDYFNFILTLTDSQEIKNRMLKMNDDLICYVVDAPGRTKIPRILEGDDRSFNLPHRAVAFVREQSAVTKDRERYYEFKFGFAYRKKETNPGAKFHELNHNLASQLSMKIADGEILKFGSNIQSLDIVNDKFISKTGNFLDEALTDAIAKYYYENKCEKQDKPEYQTEYRRSGMTLFAEILLGNDLSNKDLLNAYLGSPEDLNKFNKKFKERTNFNFERILKMDFNSSKSLDNENISIIELIKLSVIYRIKSAKTKETLESEIKFLKSLNILEELKQCLSDDSIKELKTFLNTEYKSAEEKFQPLEI